MRAGSSIQWTVLAVLASCSAPNPLYSLQADPSGTGATGTDDGAGPDGGVGDGGDGSDGPDGSGGSGDATAGDDTGQSTAWWNPDWCARVPITVAADTVSADLPDFPLLVVVDGLEDLAQARSDGGDFVFVADATGQVLSHEVDLFRQPVSLLVAWVKLPILAAGQSTSLHLYFCNPDADSNADPHSVWSGYAAVWHLGDTLANGSRDATGNDNTGTPAGAMTADQVLPGIIGRAYRFDGVDDSIDIKSSSELRMESSGTISAWVLAEGWQPNIGPIFTKAATNGSTTDNNAYFIRAGDGELDFTVRTSYMGPGLGWGGWTDLGAWHHVAGTYDGAWQRVYFDGVLVAETMRTGNVIDPDFPAHIGSWGTADADRWWKGLIDEVRFQSVVRDAPWLAAEVDNQSNPSAFAVVGAVQYL